MYHSIGAVSTLTPEQQAAALAVGLQAIPSCYSRELDDCLNSRPNNFPGCLAINNAYDSSPANFEKIDAVVESLPICEGVSRTMVMVIAGGTLVAGVVLGALLSGKKQPA